MTPDILPYAILTGTAVVLGGWAAVGWMRAETRIAALEAELSDARGQIALLDAAFGALSDYLANEPARISAHMREIGLKGNQSPKRKWKAAA